MVNEDGVMMDKTGMEKGPLLTDKEFFEKCLNLDYEGLQQTAEWVKKKIMEERGQLLHLIFGKVCVRKGF